MSLGSTYTRCKLFAPILLIGVFCVFFFSVAPPAHAATGINQQINFQGRLLNAQGATVPDGYYNIEFKIYQDGDGQSQGDTTGSPAGSLKWTEDYVNNNANQGVKVQNGFLSVQLGSNNPFGSSIDWNQDTLWISMNVAGASNACTSFASCSPDGEMIPMKRLSAAPYALNARLFGGLSSSQYVQLAQGLQTDASSGVNSIYINKTGTGNLIDLQSSGNDAFVVSNSGDVSFGSNANHTVSVIASAAGVAGKSLTLSAGSAGTGGSALTGGNLVLQGGAGGGTNGNGGSVTIDAGVKNGSGTDGTISIGANNASAISIGNTTNNVATTINGTAVVKPTAGHDSTTAFQIQSAATTPVVTVDTTKSQLQIRGLNDAGVAGNEMFTNSETFNAASGWTGISGTGGSATATHNSNGGTTATSASPNLSVANGSVYKVTYTVSSMTSGNIHSAIGGVSGNSVTANGTQTDYITSGGTGDLSFIPSNSFDGTISGVSAKLVTNQTPSLVIQDSTGTTAAELRVSTNSNGNLALGYQSLPIASGASSTSGTQNVAFGEQTLQFNTSGYGNAALGYQALQFNTTGIKDTAVGYQALQNSSTASTNSAVGYQALQADITGNDNTGVGYLSLYQTLGGNANSAVGRRTLGDIINGGNNAALGNQAGYTGTQSDFQTLNSINSSTLVGAFTQSTCSSCVVLGGQGADAVSYGFGTPNPTNFVSIEPVEYNTGTVATTSSSGNVVGTGTIFAASMVGSEIYIASNSTSTATYKGVVTAFTDATHITVSPTVSFTVPTGHFYILYSGFQVTSTGTAYARGTSATQFAVQNAGGTSVLNVDSTNQQVSVRNLNDAAVVGAELFTASESFAAAGGWGSISGTGASATATHTNGGGVTAISASPALSVSSGAVYMVTYTVSGMTQGSINSSIGGVSGATISSNTTEIDFITTTGAGNLQFIPTNTFDGTVTGVSVKLMSTQVPTLVINDSTGANAAQVRVSASSVGNLGVGLNALQYASGVSAINGEFNTSLGTGALQSDTSGYNNAALGYQALNANQGGFNNTALGELSMQHNVTGSSNTAIGTTALQNNTTGNNNVVVGGNALTVNTSGGQNVALGVSSLTSSSSGSGNAAVGYHVLRQNTTGSNNSALGINAGSNGTNQNDFQTLNNISSSTIVGQGAQATCSSCLILGGQGADALIGVGIGTPNPTNFLSAEPLEYNTGTVATTNGSGAVVGTGTTFTSSMVGSEIYIASNSNTTATYKGTISGFTDATHISATPAVTFNIAGAHYYILYIGLQVSGGATTGGYVGIGTLSPQYSLDVAGTGNFSTSVLTSTLDTASNIALNIGTTNAGNIFIGNNAGLHNIIIGNATSSTAVTVDCGTGTCAFGTTGTAHATNIGSTTGASSTTIQSGSGGISLSGATTISGSNTFTSGTGNVSLQGATTVSANFAVTSAGYAAFQKGTDYAMTGYSNNVNLGSSSLVRLTGTSAQTITGISGGADGRILTLVNAAGQSATISNLSSSSTAANQISTGTGSDVTLPAGASITLVYDTAASVWRMVGSVSTPGGYIFLQVTTPGTTQMGSFNISGTGIASTALLTSLLDTPSGTTTLNVGTNNATAGISLNQSTTVSGTKTFTVNGGLTTLQGGLTVSGGAVQLDVNTNSNTSINSGTSTGSVSIGNSASGAVQIASGAASSFITSNTLQLSGSNFSVGTNGVMQLAGNQSKDITTADGSSVSTISIKPGTTNGSNSTGASATFSAGDNSSTSCNLGCSGGSLNITAGSETGASGTTRGGSVTIDAGSGATANGSISIGTTNSTGITLGRSSTTITSAGSLTVNANQSLSLQSGTGTFSQTYLSSSSGNAQSLLATNTNSGGSNVAIKLQDVTLSGTDTSGGVNANSAYYFENPTAHTNNSYYGLNFAGTGYNDVLRVNGNQIINGSGVLQSAGLSGTYSNALTLNNSGNTIAGVLNGVTLAAQSDGFTVAGGSTSARTLTVTGADITIGNTIQPTSNGAIKLQSTGAFALNLDVGGAAAVNIATGTNGSAINLGNTTSNPTVHFYGSGQFDTTTGTINLNGNTTVSGTKTFTVNGGLTTLQGGLTVSGGAVQLDVNTNSNTSINSGTSTGSVSIGNSASGAVQIASGAASSFITSNTLQLSGSNFSVGTNGVMQLAGGQAADITTPNITSGTASTTNLTIKAGDQSAALCGSGCAGGSVTIKAGSATGGGGNNAGGSLTFDAGAGSGTGATNGAISVGTTNAASITIGHSSMTTTVGGNLSVNQTLSANGGVTVAANQNLQLQTGTGVFSQAYNNSAAGSAQTLSLTNSNSGASSIALNGYDITLVGTPTSGGTNTNSALKFEAPTTAANNVFYGLNFATANYTDILRVNSQQIINGSGVLQSAGLSGTYSNALTLNNSGNTIAGVLNGVTLAAQSDGFTVAGGSTSARTLTVTGADITIGNTIQPTSNGAIKLQSTGAFALNLDVGGAAAVNIATGTNGTAINFGNGTSNPNIAFNGTGNFSTTSGNVSLNGNVAVASGKNFSQSGNGTFTTGTGGVSLNGSTTVAPAASSTAFVVQNAAPRNIFDVDTNSNIVNIGNATDGAQLLLAGGGSVGAQLNFGTTGNANGVITKTMIVTGSVNANDLIEIDPSNAGQVQQAGTSSTRLFGIATATGSGGTSQNIVIGGIYQVNANSSNGTISIGTLLVSSSTAGQATAAGLTTSPGSVIGMAMSTLSGGKVWVDISYSDGGNENLQTAYAKSSSTAPEIKLNSTNGAVNIQDADTTLGGSLLTVRGSNSSGFGAPLLDVQSTGDASVLGSFMNPYGGLGVYGNLITYSEQLDNAAWTTSGTLTVTANTTAAPDTNVTADTLAGTTSGASIGNSSATAITATAATYNFSVWLKTSSGTQSAQLRIDGSSGGTGTATSVTATTSWQRFSVSQSVATGTGFSGNVRAVILPGAASTGTVIAWGAQLVQSSTPVVYSRTTSTATSTTDGLTVNGTTTNNGSSINTTLALGNFATGGSIGTAPATVDIYTSISIAQTTSGQTLLLPSPTANAMYGRLLYLSNVGSQAFILGGIRIPANDTAALVWSNTNGGASWQFAGAGGSSIENQNASDQTADFRISGTGRATSFVSPVIDSITGALAIGSGNASAINLGNTTSNILTTVNGTLLVQPTPSHDSTTALQVKSAGGTAILTIDTVNSMVQIGSSTANTGTTIFALNNNNGTTTPTEVDGGMYYNSSTSQFLCGENGFWVNCGVPPRDHSFDLYDEFMSGNSGSLATGAYGIGGLNWYNSLIGAPGALTYNNNPTTGNAPAASADRPGILNVEQTGNGNGTGQTTSLGIASMLLGTSRLDYKTAVNITAPQSTYLIGLHNETTATTAPTTGVYWKESGAGTWQYCYVNATPAETCTNSTVTQTAGTWYRLEIQVVSSTEVDFYINGTKYAATGITYNTTNKVSPAYTSYKTQGTPTTQDIYIDYFELLGTTSAAR